MDLLTDLRTKAARDRAWLVGDRDWMRRWLLNRADAAGASAPERKSAFRAKCLELAAAHAPGLRRKALPTSFRELDAGNPLVPHWLFEPRIPAGSGEESGRWTRLAGDVPGLGHNQGPPLDEQPKLPKERPTVSRERTNAMLEAARFGRQRGLGALSALIQSIPWLREQADIITAGSDPPDTLENLQAAVSDPRSGYQIHHIAEQGPAKRDGFLSDRIDSRDNLVRIPIIVHRDITGWFGRLNPEYDGKSPRDYLRGKSWEERREVGLKALRIFGILKQ